MCADLVEVTFPRSHALYQNKELRALNSAATQYVLARPQPGEAIQTVGATPKDLVEETYLVVPLVSLDTNMAGILDHASDVAAKDVIPPRPAGPMRLNDFQTKSLKQSMKMIYDLQDTINKGGEGIEGSHCVQYTVAFSTLVHNPKGVEHFCKTIKSLATDGCVDCVPVEGLASAHGSGEEVGEFISINAYVPV